MNTIHVLPPQLIAKIAAGEVIERPAFVIKELVENALDAKATQITIEVTKGGTESITVTDNGIGMSVSDLLLCWQQHTTSKLLPDSDLATIASLGFRGEALASITAISDVSIQSRQADTRAGHVIQLSHGKLLENAVVGMAPGTIVRVSNVFARLPARQKFLGTAQTEWKYCIRCIEGLTLSHPEVRFIVTHNNRLVFDLPSQSPLERLTAVLGAEVANQIVPISITQPYATISGFIGTPQLSFHTNLPSYLIVNQRVIKSKAINQTIKNSYHGLLKVEASPFYLLYFQVPVETIDVNIHPRKEEIKFLNQTDVTTAIAEYIATIASQHNLSHRWTTPKGDTHSIAAAAVRSEILSSMENISPTKQNYPASQPLFNRSDHPRYDHY